jgi:hypothetical protein
VSLRNSSGSPLWHLNGINGGLNFAHTDVADAVLFLGANNSVGIGTSNPQAALDVNGTVQASGPIKAVGGLVIENRTSDPPSPATGQIWLRTDL